MFHLHVSHMPFVSLWQESCKSLMLKLWACNINTIIISGLFIETGSHYAPWTDLDRTHFVKQGELNK